MENFLDLQEKIGYTFKDPVLLRHALIHSSYANEHGMPKFSDNERYEFLGDSVLELVSSDFLFHNYPDQNEGQMSKLRASLVCEMALADVANELSIGRFVFLSNGEEKTGGRELKSILSDALESVIGAIYLDGGLAPADAFIRKNILTDIENRTLFYDAKTVLQELIQAGSYGPLHYEETKETGPEHRKTFFMQAFVGDRLIGEGSGATKKAAEQEAAYRGLLLLRKEEDAKKIR